MQTEKDYSTDQSSITRFLITGGAIGPLLFMIVLLIEGATRPGYSAWHNYGSSLSLSDQGWMQITNFLVCGLLTLGFAVGLKQVLHKGKGSDWRIQYSLDCGWSLCHRPEPGIPAGHA